MRQNLYRIVKPTVIVAAIGFSYLILHELTGFSLFCPVWRFLHLYCPGCGVSRMFFHLFRLELYEAFSSNCVVFCLLPVGLAAAVFHGYRYVRYNNGRFFRWERIALWVIVGILVVFGILRNIWRTDLLIP